MKYLFGDSTKSPLQRDFLGLLDNFVDTSIKIVTLENTIAAHKESISDRRRLKNSVLEEMDSFSSTVEDAISKAISTSKEREPIAQYAEKSKHFLKTFINDGKRELSDSITKETEQLEGKIKEKHEETRKILESFFLQDPIPIINKKFTVKVAEEGYSATVEVDCEGDITCVFTINASELPFWDGHVKGFDFLRGVEVPARMKKPLFKNELEPDSISLDYYYLTDLIFSEQKLETVFRKTLHIESDRFRLKMDFSDEFQVEVHHADENDVEKSIKAVPELKTKLNSHRMNEFGDKIIEQTNALYSKKQRLDGLYLAGKEVITKNLLFDLVEKIAEIYSPTVAEVKKHTPSTEELSLKEEDETGKRKEIYLKKSQVREKLSAIKGKGDVLLDILGLRH